MQTEETSAIKVTQRLEAPAERVFDAWLNPAVARKWLFVTDDGEITRCDLDAQVGGEWTIVRRGPSPEPPGEVIDMEHTGQYLEIDPPRRLAFTFGVPKFSPNMSRVMIDIAPAGSGCELSLITDGVPEDWREQTEQGWRMILGNLAKAVS